MNKSERKRLIDVLDLWIASCESFYDTFKKDFPIRPDAVNELKARCDKVYFINEFLEEGGFITIDKYLEIADRYEKVLNNLYKAVDNGK
jgi:Fe-S oxidoreductase